jgi:hypothetical protein
MRLSLVVMGLLVSVPPLMGAEDAEAQIKDLLKLINETEVILRAVKDKSSAEMALPKLKANGERFAALEKQLNKVPAEQQKRLQARYEKTAQKAHHALQREVERVEKLPQAAAVLKEVYPLKQASEARARIARLQVKHIQVACDAYKLSEGEFPRSLDLLTKGETPYLKAEDLLDPWKKPYRYDSTGPKNKGITPDIWTVTPDKQTIGNWKEEKK